MEERLLFKKKKQIRDEFSYGACFSWKELATDIQTDRPIASAAHTFTFTTEQIVTMVISEYIRDEIVRNGETCLIYLVDMHTYARRPP